MLFHFKMTLIALLFFGAMSQYLQFYFMSFYSQITILYAAVFSHVGIVEINESFGFNQNYCFVSQLPGKEPTDVDDAPASAR